MRCASRQGRSVQPSFNKEFVSIAPFHFKLPFFVSVKSGRMNRLVTLLALTVSGAAAFVPRTPSRSSSPNWQLYEVIRGEVVQSEPIDTGLGGVRLAQESAIKIAGEVRHKPGSAEARPNDLIRYTQLTTVDESKVNGVFGKIGGKILATGQGVELYKDPGDTLEAIVKLGPMEAIKDAANGAASAIDETTLVFNFLGGDDLIMTEVTDATNELVVMMDIATKAKITFNSMSHSSIPMGTCTVTVVAIGESEEKFFGVEESIAAGEVYGRDGVWYTVDKANINTAVA